MARRKASDIAEAEAAAFARAQQEGRLAREKALAMVLREVTNMPVLDDEARQRITELMGDGGDVHPTR